MSMIWQLSNDVNFMNEHRHKNCESETMASEIIKAVSLLFLNHANLSR